MSEDDKRLLLTNEFEDTKWNLLAARIRGIRDPDLITTLIETEINHQQRQGVIAALNRRKRVLDENPRFARPIEELPTAPNQDENNHPPPVFRDRDGTIREDRSTARDKARNGLLTPDGGSEE